MKILEKLLWVKEMTIQLVVCYIILISKIDHYKMIAIDLSKQQALDADPRAIQQINFTVNLDRAGNTTMFFIIKKSKRNCVRLFKRNCKSFVECNSIECNFVEYSFIKCNFNE